MKINPQVREAAKLLRQLNKDGVVPVYSEQWRKIDLDTRIQAGRLVEKVS